MTTLFRLLIVVSTLIFLVSLALPYFDWRWLTEWQISMVHEAGYDAIVYVSMTIYAPLLIAFLVSSIGMFFFQAWARLLFALTSAVAVIFSVLGGMDIQPGYARALTDLNLLLDGAIIAIAYLTGLSARFRHAA